MDADGKNGVLFCNISDVDGAGTSFPRMPICMLKKSDIDGERGVRREEKRKVGVFWTDT